jgi:hypothetical protein
MQSSNPPPPGTHPQHHLDTRVGLHPLPHKRAATTLLARNDPALGATSGKMSPFEFLEDLKRDRSSSLETLHHMLRCAITGIILLARFCVIDCDARTVAKRRCGQQWWAAVHSSPPPCRAAIFAQCDPLRRRWISRRRMTAASVR